MPKPLPRILVADDQPDVVQALRLLLKAEGFEVDSASSPREVVALVEKKDFDVVLMDLNYTRDTTSGLEGMELLRTLRKADALRGFHCFAGDVFGEEGQKGEYAAQNIGAGHKESAPVR